MTEHMLNGFAREDGFDVAVCVCGAKSPPSPDAATAANFWGQHLLAVADRGPEPAPSGDVVYIDPAEFIAVGFLQELNRQFLHPLGLALECDPNLGPDEYSMRVWDYRDDPEGIAFTVDTDPAKRGRVSAEQERHREARMRRFGWMVQPVGATAVPTDHDAS